MQVTKMHGLGNDYIYVDLFHERVADAPRLARAVSDRHTGIGSDGLIVMQPASDATAHLRMRIFNADGSEAQMCGNGIRCVVRYASERGLCSENPMRVETGAGVLSVVWSAGPPFEASVQMGAPRFLCEHIPAHVPGVPATAELLGWHLPAGFWQECNAPLQWMQACGCEATLSLVNMGNPHAVLWCADVSKFPLQSVGAFVESHPWFPQRINVHCVEVVHSNTLRMRTWERGSGITLACGTGASAVAAVAIRQGRAHSPIHAQLPGGELDISWSGAQSSVVMKGSATFVMSGELSPELIAEAG